MKETESIINITKEELAQLPVVSYNGRIVVVDRPEQAHAALRALANEKLLGFDTETRPSFHKGARHKVALLQIATADCCYLFRLNKLGICTEMVQLLENPDIIKIGLSVHDDFHAISRTQGFQPGGFVDLQCLVKDYGIADCSLQKIFAIIFGQRISKGQRLTNWEAETLTSSQQAYAALDAWACLKIYNYLKAGKFDSDACPYKHPVVEETK